jgi:hypothetical protein
MYRTELDVDVVDGYRQPVERDLFGKNYPASGEVWPVVLRAYYWYPQSIEDRQNDPNAYMP